MSDVRIWSSPQCLNGEVEGDEWRHLSRVLRLGMGDTYRFICGDGMEYQARIVTVGKQQGQIEILDREALPRSPVSVTLCVGLLKGEQMDQVVQMATELGVGRIVPMLTDHCVARTGREERWRRIAASSTAQARRGYCPEVAPVASFAAALEAGPALVFWERQRGPGPLEGVRSPVSVMVGPEGGFSDAEVALARSLGARLCSLGDGILRAATAAVVAPAVVLRALGALG